MRFGEAESVSAWGCVERGDFCTVVGAPTTCRCITCVLTTCICTPFQRRIREESTPFQRRLLERKYPFSAWKTPLNHSDLWITFCGA